MTEHTVLQQMNAQADIVSIITAVHILIIAETLTAIQARHTVHATLTAIISSLTVITAHQLRSAQAVTACITTAVQVQLTAETLTAIQARHTVHATLTARITGLMELRVHTQDNASADTVCIAPAVPVLFTVVTITAITGAGKHVLNALLTAVNATESPAHLLQSAITLTACITTAVQIFIIAVIPTVILLMSHIGTAARTARVLQAMSVI